MDTRERKPTSVGEMLTEEFLEPMGMSRDALAKIMEVDRATVDELISGTRSVTPDIAAALSKAFGNTAGFWLNCQAATDRWLARR